MERKGQGALEYLLLIGAAVGIAAIVMLVMFNLAQQQEVQTARKEISLICAQQMNVADCETEVGTVTRNTSIYVIEADCTWTAGTGCVAENFTETAN